MTDTLSSALTSREAVDAVTVDIRMPDPQRAGFIDVITLRGLVRAFRVLRGGGTTNDFDRAFAKIVNLNGALAQVIEHGRGYR